MGRIILQTLLLCSHALHTTFDKQHTDQPGALRNTRIYLFLFVLHFNIKFPAPSPHLHLLGHHEHTLQLLVNASERLRVERKAPSAEQGCGVHGDHSRCPQASKGNHKALQPGVYRSREQK